MELAHTAELLCQESQWHVVCDVLCARCTRESHQSQRAAALTQS